MAIYATILEQHGLKVASTSLIPIKLDFEYEDEYTIRSLRNINAPTVSELESDPIKKQVINISGALIGKQAQNIRRRILPVKPEINSESIETILRVYNNFFPGVEVDSSVHRREASVEYIKQKQSRTLSSNHYQYIHNNKRFSFYRAETDGQIEYYETEEQLDKAIAAYVETVNNNRSNELINLASLIQSELLGEKDFTKLGESFSPEKQSIIHEQFKKYFIQPG